MGADAEHRRGSLAIAWGGFGLGLSKARCSLCKCVYQESFVGQNS